MQIVEKQWVECLLNDKNTYGQKLKEMCAMRTVLQLITTAVFFSLYAEKPKEPGESGVGGGWWRGQGRETPGPDLNRTKNNGCLHLLRGHLPSVGLATVFKHGLANSSAFFI